MMVCSISVLKNFAHFLFGKYSINLLLRIKTNNYTTSINPISDQFKTTLRTKEPIQVPTIYTEEPHITSLPKSYAMDYKGILKKPFLIGTFSWPTTATQFTELVRLQFPQCVQTNTLASIPFNASEFFSSQQCVMLQVAGTPMHQGCLLAAILPPGAPAVSNINSILCAPHSFLFANEQTSVCLDAPMVRNTSLIPTSASTNTIPPPGGFGMFDLVLFVVNPLQSTATATQTLSLSVSCIFKKLNFYVPKYGNMTYQAQCLFSNDTNCQCEDEACSCSARTHSKVTDKVTNVAQSLVDEMLELPTKILDAGADGLKAFAGDLIDMGRGFIKHLTGFHNPNIPNLEHGIIVNFKNRTNNVDIPTHQEVMDNHGKFVRIYDDFYFRTKTDEMSIKQILSVPAYLGTFAINTGDPVGKNLMAYPIIPCPEVTIAGGAINTIYAAPMRKLFETSRYWRGKIKLHLQICATNFHYCKIIVLRNYDRQVQQTANVPTYSGIHNINTDTIEISGGAQNHVIDLDYCSQYKQLWCTKDTSAAALSHGIVYIYLAQQLVTNGTVPTTIYVNAYYTAEDVEFSGYNTDYALSLACNPPTYTTLPVALNNAPAIFYDNSYMTQEDKDQLIKSKVTSAIKANPKIKYIKFPKSFKISYVESLFDNPLQQVQIKKENFLPPFIVDVKSKSVYPAQEIKLEEKEILEYFETYPSNAVNNIAVRPIHKPADRESLENVAQSNYDQDIPLEEYLKQNTPSGETGAVATKTSQIQRKDPDCRSTNIVKVSDQCGVVNKSAASDPALGMSFQPNVSLRDYLRQYHPLDPIVVSGSTQCISTLAVDSFLANAGNLNGFQMLTNMFLGLSGGLKFKFRITNVSLAYAQYFPPGVIIPRATTAAFAPTQTFPSVWDANLTANMYNHLGPVPVATAWSSPVIELQDYCRPSATASYIGSTVEFEMVIPNMNLGNYAGSVDKWYNNKTTETDLGTIAICVQPSTNGTSYAGFVITPYIALADEARLGYQMFSPAVQIPTLTNTSTNIVRSSIDNIATPYNGFPQPGAPPINSLIFPAPYYFKTT